MISSIIIDISISIIININGWATNGSAAWGTRHVRRSAVIWYDIIYHHIIYYNTLYYTRIYYNILYYNSHSHLLLELILSVCGVSGIRLFGEEKSKGLLVSRRNPLCCLLTHVTMDVLFMQALWLARKRVASFSLETYRTSIVLVLFNNISRSWTYISRWLGFVIVYTLLQLYCCVLFRELLQISLCLCFVRFVLFTFSSCNVAEGAIFRALRHPRGNHICHDPLQPTESQTWCLATPCDPPESRPAPKKLDQNRCSWFDDYHYYYLYRHDH